MKKNNIMKISKWVGLIALFAMVWGQVSAQKTFLLTEQEMEKLRNEKDCNCPPVKEQVVIREVPVVANQGGRLSLLLSGGGNYLYGADIADKSTFEADYLSWQAELMLGVTYGGGKIGKGSTFGAFLRGGNTTRQGVERFLQETDIVGGVFERAEQNIFANLEAGAILFELIRVSTGLGFQEYKNLDESLQRINYYSTTAGLHLGSKNVKLIIELNFMYGRDLGNSNTMIRPMAGLGIKL
jgi:hypothetical protein